MSFVTLAKKEKRPISWKVKENIFSLTYLAPFLTMFILFTVLPILIAVFFSFTNYNIFEFPKVIWFDNYMEMFFGDDEFLIALKNTLIIAVISGPAGYFASLAVAWFINDLHPKIRPAMVLLFYAPSISGNAYMIWTLMFSGDAYGYANSMLMYLGVIDEPIQWLTDPSYMMPLVVAVQIWISLGSGFLSFVAGLRGIDRSYYEVGYIEGIRNRWQELWYVTLPAIKPQLIFGAVMSISGAFSCGAISTALCGFPSTDYAVHTLMNHLEDFGGTKMEMGYACAISTVLTLLMLGTNKLIQKALSNVGN